MKAGARLESRRFAGVEVSPSLLSVGGAWCQTEAPVLDAEADAYIDFGCDVGLSALATGVEFVGTHGLLAGLCLGTGLASDGFGGGDDVGRGRVTVAGQEAKTCCSAAFSVGVTQSRYLNLAATAAIA